MGHALKENRNGLAVAGVTTIASGYAERDAALELTPHVAQNTTKRSSMIDRRTTRHAGYEVSQRKRKRVEEVLGWMKTVGILRKVKLWGRVLVDSLFRFGLTVHNLVRKRSLTPEMAR